MEYLVEIRFDSHVVSSTLFWHCMSQTMFTNFSNGGVRLIQGCSLSRLILFMAKGKKLLWNVVAESWSPCSFATGLISLFLPSGFLRGAGGVSGRELLVPGMAKWITLRFSYSLWHDLGDTDASPTIGQRLLQSVMAITPEAATALLGASDHTTFFELWGQLQYSYTTKFKCQVVQCAQHHGNWAMGLSQNNVFSIWTPKWQSSRKHSWWVWMLWENLCTICDRSVSKQTNRHYRFSTSCHDFSSRRLLSKIFTLNETSHL